MRVTSFLLLATLFVITWEKVHWDVAGSVGLHDVLTILFLVAFALERRARAASRAPRTVAIVVVFFAAFALVYLLGFFNLGTKQAVDQYAKGMVKFVLHFCLLAAGVTLLYERGREYYWRALAWFSLGFAANAAYGLLQLAAVKAGFNLDKHVLQPITGGASAINIYGAVQGQSVYRVNGLAVDPNHLGVMLAMPLLFLTPLYLRLERGHRLRIPLAVLLAFLLLVEIATLSRSGALGVVVGAAVLAVVYRRKLATWALLAPLGALAVVLAYVVLQRRHFFEVVLKSRLSTSSRSTVTHFQIYDFVPQILHSHPLLGLGLNNFSVYYEFVTGKANWGPHSFYVALIVESGLIGTALFMTFLLYVLHRLARARELGRRLAALRDPVAARIRPLAWGFTAALVGTLAANAFYLTMQFYYFYAFVMLALALPLVFSRGGSGAASRAPAGRRPR
jgi:O-antigen ligase